MKLLKRTLFLASAIGTLMVACGDATPPSGGLFGSSDAGCAGLTKCCAVITDAASKTMCTTAANQYSQVNDGDTKCQPLLDMYTVIAMPQGCPAPVPGTGGAAGASSAGAGGTSSGTGCIGLTACCASIVDANLRLGCMNLEKMNSMQTSAAAADAACSASLATYKSGGICGATGVGGSGPGVGGSGPGVGGSGGSGPGVGGAGPGVGGSDPGVGGSGPGPGAGGTGPGPGAGGSGTSGSTSFGQGGTGTAGTSSFGQGGTGTAGKGGSTAGTGGKSGASGSGTGGSGPTACTTGACQGNPCVVSTLPFTSSCSSCVAAVCAADTYCCGGMTGGHWDQTCVNEVAMYCTNICHCLPRRGGRSNRLRREIARRSGGRCLRLRA